MLGSACSLTGAPPPPKPPRSAARRPYAGVGLASGYRSQSPMHHRIVFGRWPCSPLGLRSPLPALVHRGFAARLMTIAIRSCRRCRSIDQRFSVKPFRAAARFITFAAVVRAQGRVGLGARASGPSRRPASSLRSSACVLRYAWPQPRAHGAPSSGARSRWSRAPLLGRTFATRAKLRACRRAPLAPLGATRATSGTLNYSRDVRGLYVETLRYDIPRPTPANVVSTQTFPSHRIPFCGGFAPYAPSVLIRGINY